MKAFGISTAIAATTLLFNAVYADVDPIVIKVRPTPSITSGRQSDRLVTGIEVLLSNEWHAIVWYHLAMFGEALLT